MAPTRSSISTSRAGGDDVARSRTSVSSSRVALSRTGVAAAVHTTAYAVDSTSGAKRSSVTCSRINPAGVGLGEHLQRRGETLIPEHSREDPVRDLSQGIGRVSDVQGDGVEHGGSVLAR